MIPQETVKIFDRDGVCVIKGVLDSPLITILRHELELAIGEQSVKFPHVFDAGMVHNCMFYGEHLAKILNHPVLNDCVKMFLTNTAILYAYQSSSLFPKKGNYGSRIHVDCPRFIPGYISNIGVILPLDDFSNDNGATFYLKGSHKSKELPSESYFYKYASRVTCQAGDMIVFNARLVHAAGVNNTLQTRHALTLNFCRSYMRQRFDYPKMIDDNCLAMLNDDGRRMIGMNVRVPSSLDEFYLPEAQRLYQPNQG